MSTKRKAFAAVLILVGLTAGACSSANDAAAPATTRRTALATSTTAPSTTTTVATTSTSGRPAGTTSTTSRPRQSTTTTRSPPADTQPDERGRFGRPEDAANHLYRAWRDGDRDRASVSGRPAAVNALFSLPGYPGGFAFEGCTFRDGGYDCRFEGAAEALVMRVEGGASDGWRVATVSLRS